MTAAYEQYEQSRKRIGEVEFEKLSTVLRHTESNYTRHKGISLGEHLAAVAVEEMMTIVVAKIRAKEKELRDLCEKIWDDKTQEVNSRHAESDRYAEQAMVLEHFGDILEL